MDPNPRDWSILPAGLQYLAGPAERYGVYEYHDELLGAADRLTAQERAELTQVAKRFLQDYEAIDAWRDKHSFTESVESWRVYNLERLLEYSRLFDAAEAEDEGPAPAGTSASIAERLRMLLEKARAREGAALGVTATQGMRPALSAEGPAALARLKELEDAFDLLALVGIPSELAAALAGPNLRNPAVPLAKLRSFLSDRTASKAEDARRAIVQWVQDSLGDGDEFRRWEAGFRHTKMGTFLQADGGEQGIAH